MKIIVDIQDIDPKVVDLFVDNKLEGGFSIDYALNALTSHYQGKEVIVFDFSPFVLLDNRLPRAKYRVYSSTSQILIIFK